MKSYKTFVRESTQRGAEIFKAKDKQWYYTIDGKSYGPFSDDKKAEADMLSKHSNPGGMFVDKRGTKEVPNI